MVRGLTCLIAVGLALAATACQRSTAGDVLTADGTGVLLDADFRRGPGLASTPGLELLPGAMASTGLTWLEHRQTWAFTRKLDDQPRWPNGSLNIARNEVGQGMYRRFATGAPLDPARHALVLQLTTMSDAALSATNATAVRLWAQEGNGANHHRDRIELSHHYNTHPRGARQVYPNAYSVRDGWERWAMPEGVNDRRAGIYYRLGAEGHNEVIRGPEAVPKGYYWTWQGLDWAQGWHPPLGAALYPAPAQADDLPPQLVDSHQSTVIYRRGDTVLTAQADRFSTQVDVIAPRQRGRLSLSSPLPQRIDEVRIILRSEVADDGQWSARLPAAGSDLHLGVLEAAVRIVMRADATLDGRVDAADWERARAAFGRRDALHVDGDGNGDGRVDSDDLLLIAASWSAVEAARPDPSGWQAERGADGHLRLHLPAHSRLYGWQVRATSGTLSTGAGGLAAIAHHPEAVLEEGEHRLAVIHLGDPLVITEQVSLDLGPVSGSVGDHSLVLRLITHRGQEARRLPIWSAPEAALPAAASE